MAKYRWTMVIDVDAGDEVEAEERLQEQMDEYMNIMAYDGMLDCGRLEKQVPSENVMGATIWQEVNKGKVGVDAEQSDDRAD